ncbi:hypothetical protein OH77DRAFT_1431935 [Trametes cingulata]|nr:hypothetical protein OH77DRAFT_1431935 [Trametes cingulata]
MSPSAPSDISAQTPSNTSAPPVSSSSPKDSTPSSSSLEDQLDRLTTTVQETAHQLHVCSAACAERCALARARDDEEKRRTESVHEQLARLLAMTREGVRREREERVTTSPETYVQDLRRAAFGAGRTPESISRSSMMESVDPAD